MTVEVGDLYLRPDWPAPANVHAATTLRSGGVSVGPYASLNPACHVGDQHESVLYNRQIIRTKLALPSEPVWLEQIHSNLAVEAMASHEIQRADASFTRQSGVVCAVMTADCLPLLVCAADGRQVAAIHAGWRGLVDGIISNTLDAFEHRDVLVWLGPAIGVESFEVGEDVYDAFTDKSERYSAAFKEQADGKYLADIYELARIELSGLGVDKIYGGGLCTYTDAERFYSYRRDHVTGRIVSLIWRD